MEKKLLLGNNLEKLRELEDNSIDSIVSDPPYGLSFMNKKWDYDVPSVAFWKEVYRVLKPGGHILSFGGTRTYHRMVVNIEDAGFEIRDCIQWLYGSGFPKSHNIGKATNDDNWEGWGTALKPSNEPIVMARKPLEESTVAKNVLKYGTGGINIDDSRIGNGKWDGIIEESNGRFPANIILDETAAEELDKQSGISKPKKERIGIRGGRTIHEGGWKKDNEGKWPGDNGGGASRFFYTSKASKKERNLGLKSYSTHPTVKPIQLMSYLCKLITPPNGTILDPYMGSGSTGIAALLNGFNFVGMEMEEEYFNIASSRIDNYEEYRQFLK